MGIIRPNIYVVHVTFKKLSFPKPVLKAHAEFLQEIDKDGKLLFVGPYVDGSGAIFLLKKVNREEAEKIMHKDPYKIENLVEHEIKAVREANEDNKYLGLLDLGE